MFAAAKKGNGFWGGVQQKGFGIRIWKLKKTFSKKDQKSFAG